MQPREDPYRTFLSELWRRLAEILRELHEPPKDKENYLAFAGNRGAWARLVGELGWPLDPDSSELSGRYGRLHARIELPASYLGGRGAIRLAGERVQAPLEVRPGGWWGDGEVVVVVGDATRLPAGLAESLARHEVELTLEGTRLTATLPRCKADAVRELLPPLAALLEGPASYRVAAS